MPDDKPPQLHDEWEALAREWRSVAIALAEELEAARDEIKRLRLASALRAYRRPRGRPKKAKPATAPKGKAGRPKTNTPKFLTSLIALVDEIKLANGLRTDKEACERYVSDKRPGTRRPSEVREMQKLVSEARVQSRKSGK